jgi:ribosomal protein L21E
MRKNIVLTLSISAIAILTFVFGNEHLTKYLSRPTLAQANSAQSKVVSIKSVKLDKYQAVTFCPSHKFFSSRKGFTGGCLEKDAEINISTELNGSDEGIEFQYIVSSGQITGEGKNVVWSPLYTKFGKHKLTVGISKDGKIIGKTISKTFEFNECQATCHEPPCECAESKFGQIPKQVKRGDTIVLSIKTDPSNSKNMMAKWNIQGGEIINGQGTTKVLVKVGENTKTLLISAFTNTDCEACGQKIDEEIQIS